VKHIISIGLCLAAAVMLGGCTAASGGNSTPYSPTTTAVSADDQLVSQINAIKDRYPADTTARVTAATLPAFLDIACRVVKSGLGSSPEWHDLAGLLVPAGKCPAA
jgi:hypothetical protein